MKGIIVNDGGDLDVRNRHLVIGRPEADIVHRVLVSYPGEFKEKPLLGCDIKKQLNGRPDQFWRGEAKKQIKSQWIDAELKYTLDGRLEVTIKDE